MRKFVRTVGIVTLTLVGIAVAAWLGLIAYFYLGERDIVPSDDSDLRIVEEAVPDAENAYIAFLAVTNLYALSSEDGTACMNYRQWRRTGRANAGIDTNTLPSVVDRVLATNAPYFAGLRKAVALPHYQQVKDNWLAYPPVTAMMRANTLWQTKEMREIERCDYSAALGTIRDHLAFGRKVSGNPSSLLELLVGLGIGGSAYSEVISLATSDGVPDDVLTALSELMRDETDVDRAHARALKCDYTHFVEGGMGIARLQKVIEPESFVYFLAYDTMRSRLVARAIDIVVAWMPGSWRFAFQPGATKQACADAFRVALAGGNEGSAVQSPTSIFEPNWAGKTLARQFVPGGMDGCKQEVLRLRLARLVVEAQRYRRANGGTYPPSLDALVPKYLDAVPRDPFAPDFELRYDAAKGIVWSVGTDANFNPLIEKPHNLSRFRIYFDRYAARFDDKPHEPWKAEKRVKKTVPRSGSPAAEK